MVATSLPHGPVAAQAGDETSESVEQVSVEQVSTVSEPPPRYTDDPWADPVLRWPDPLAESQLGTEPTYYWFARDDRRSLLPAATAERPLRVWAGGDSMSGGPVYGFRQLIVDDPDFRFTEDIIKSTGVVSEWFFDWIDYMARDVAEGSYDVIVLAMGANDKQRFRGLEARFGEDEWTERYRTRVRDLVAAAARPGRLVIWVGLPPLQPRHFAPLPGVVNPLAAAAVADVDGAIFVDSFDAVGVDGAYAQRLGPGQRNVRTQDGIHYTYYGGVVLTEPILAEIERRSG
ncbi:hypothetical protein [Candidatus Poriferisodalis sp.]|uniref:DUF459 domain-containing protein n=1 Tax=Candidatus Poriferisodalis sp. TaxID=3101277 RepID=UPI003B02E0D7